jgi:hypothetical protein
MIFDNTVANNCNKYTVDRTFIARNELIANASQRQIQADFYFNQKEPKSMGNTSVAIFYTYLC